MSEIFIIAAIVIASTQLSKLFGVEGKQDPAVYNVWIKVFGNIDEVSLHDVSVCAFFVSARNVCFCTVQP